MKAGIKRVEGRDSQDSRAFCSGRSPAGQRIHNTGEDTVPDKCEVHRRSLGIFSSREAGSPFERHHLISSLQWNAESPREGP